MKSLKNRKLREALIKRGVFSEHEIMFFLEEGKEAVEELALRHNTNEDEILMAESEAFNVPYVNLSEKNPEPEIVTMIPQEICMRKEIVAFAEGNGIVEAAMSNPTDVFTIDQLEAELGKKIKPYLASKGAISRKINEYVDHFKSSMVQKLLTGVRDESFQLTKKMGFEIKGIEEVAEQKPVVKGVNLIILNALLKRASDIHLLPLKDTLKVFYRVDGILVRDQEFPAAMAPAIITRIKVMSQLNIAEKRLPQDGSFHINIEGREIDFRVSVIPTIQGEKAVLRILDKSAIILGLDHLGINDNNLKCLKEVLLKPHGIILISGPTGSGKTTTLYSSLDAINNGEKNITTVENPVEYEIEGMTQIQTHGEIGLDFAQVLRSVLRQDPDVILIGEVRDLETTEIALRASLTGHLVFATVHTNDAAAAVTRFTEMGAEPYLIASSLRAVMSQRLVRTICDRCREEYEISGETSLRHFKTKNIKKLYRGRGCIHCFNTGYRGRTVISEILIINDEIRNMIISGESSVRIKEYLINKGIRTMFIDGMEKAITGETTIEEVLKVTEDAEL
ncbi:MAG: GspE/PulE family protein [Candidatus Goldiibacteriota bacterium]